MGGCVLYVTTWAPGEDRSLEAGDDAQSTCGAAALQTQPPDLGTSQAGSRKPLTQAGDPPLGVRPTALTCVRIFTVLSRLPGRQSPGGW